MWLFSVGQYDPHRLKLDKIAVHELRVMSAWQRKGARGATPKQQEHKLLKLLDDRWNNPNFLLKNAIIDVIGFVPLTNPSIRQITNNL